MLLPHLASECASDPDALDLLHRWLEVPGRHIAYGGRDGERFALILADAERNETYETRTQFTPASAIRTALAIAYYADLS